MIINERIKEQRYLSGLTLKEIADKIGVSEATVQRYESGRITVIPYESIEKLADIFGCTPGYLMGWESNVSFVGKVKSISPEETRLLEAYRNAPESRREAVRALLGMEE